MVATHPNIKCRHFSKFKNHFSTIRKSNACHVKSVNSTKFFCVGFTYTYRKSLLIRENDGKVGSWLRIERKNEPKTHSDRVLESLLMAQTLNQKRMYDVRGAYFHPLQHPTGFSIQYTFSKFSALCNVQVYYRIIDVTKLALTNSDYQRSRRVYAYYPAVGLLLWILREEKIRCGNGCEMQTPKSTH